jgi:hypothetical protein
MLAKTFWCKNTNYTENQRKEQFAGILNGLRHNLGDLPVLKGLYRNQVYLDWVHAKPIRGEYNEYAKTRIEYNDDSVDWFCGMYDTTPDEIDALEEILASSFPVKLDDGLAYRMMELDWGVANNSDLLVDDGDVGVTNNSVNFYALCVNVVLEEAFRAVHPGFGIGIGLYESLSCGSCYNFIAHLFLTLVAYEYGVFTGCVIHLAHNLFVVGDNLEFGMLVPAGHISHFRYIIHTSLAWLRKVENARL